MNTTITHVNAIVVPPHSLNADRRRMTAAFTLVELLCVCAIVGVLTSILLPGLSAARGVARQIKCASNLRQWGLLGRIYAQDNDGYLPGRGQGQMPMTSAVNVYPSNYWYNALPPLMDRPTFSALYINHQVTRPGGGNDLWLCPESVDDYSSNQAYFSYGQNMDLSPTFSGRPDHIERIGPAWSMVFMGDSGSRFCSIWPTIDSYPKDFNPVTRHRDQTNLVFLDDHVERLSRTEPGLNVNPMTMQQDGDPVRWKTPDNVWIGPNVP